MTINYTKIFTFKFDNSEFASFMTTIDALKSVAESLPKDKVFRSMETGECFTCDEIYRAIGILDGVTDGYLWTTES